MKRFKTWLKKHFIYLCGSTGFPYLIFRKYKLRRAWQLKNSDNSWTFREKYWEIPIAQIEISEESIWLICNPSWRLRNSAHTCLNVLILQQKRKLIKLFSFKNFETRTICGEGIRIFTLWIMFSIYALAYESEQKTFLTLSSIFFALEHETNLKIEEWKTHTGM